MKRNILLGIVGVLLAPVLLWVSVASAQSFRSGNSVVVPANEILDSSLWASGQNIEVAGNVNGDVFCAGQNISITGAVNGDVICAGQTVRVSGTVEGDVRAAAQTVAIGGEVMGSVSTGAQSLIIHSDGRVGRDVSTGADDITINGRIGRDLAVSSSTVTLAGRVGRNITGTVRDLVLENGAQVGGNIEYTSSNVAQIAGGAQVAGSVEQHKPVQKESDGGHGRIFGLTLGVGVYVILSLLVVALAVVLLFPKAVHETAQRAAQSPVKTLLTGFVAGIVAPVLVIALMVTVIGLPLGLLALLGWLLVLFLAGPFASYYVGRMIFRNQKRSPVTVMMIGSLVVLLLYFIPIVGFITLMLVMWMGTGMILRELFHRTPKPAYGTQKSSKK